MPEFVENSTTSQQTDHAQASVLSVQKMAIDSSSLFTQGDVVYIQHHGVRYLLRRTRNGKLILTK